MVPAPEIVPKLFTPGPPLMIPPPIVVNAVRFICPPLTVTVLALLITIFAEIVPLPVTAPSTVNVPPVRTPPLMVTVPAFPLLQAEATLRVPRILTRPFWRGMAVNVNVPPPEAVMVAPLLLMTDGPIVPDPLTRPALVRAPPRTVPFSKFRKPLLRHDSAAFRVLASRSMLPELNIAEEIVPTLPLSAA